MENPLARIFPCSSLRTDQPAAKKDRSGAKGSTLKVDGAEQNGGSASLD
jgi:hypothetical protein